MNKKGYTVVDMVKVIAVLGIMTVFMISKVSYALSDDNSQMYDLEVKLIETQAKAYGSTKIEELKQNDSIVTVNSLIKDNYLQADDDSGNIYDPRDKRKTLNDVKVSLSYNQDTNEVVAKLK